MFLNCNINADFMLNYTCTCIILQKILIFVFHCYFNEMIVRKKLTPRKSVMCLANLTITFKYLMIQGVYAICWWKDRRLMWVFSFSMTVDITCYIYGHLSPTFPPHMGTKYVERCFLVWNSIYFTFLGAARLIYRSYMHQLIDIRSV